METTYADSWSDMAQPCDMDLWVMKWRSAWPILRGPVILPYILKTIWLMYIILSEYKSVWSDVWSQNKCRSLWPIFMVQWLCLIPWRLFHVWTSLFRIVNQYDPMHDLKINVGHCDLYPWSSDCALYLEDYFMYEHHYLGLWICMTWCMTSK